MFLNLMKLIRDYIGITFIECIIVLSLMVILSVFSISSWTSMRQNNERDVLINEIKTAIHYAKIQALNRGQPVVLLSLDKEQQDWSLGMLLTLKKTQEILYQWRWHHHYWLVQWIGAQNTKAVVISDSPRHAMSNGKFILTNARTQERTMLVLNRLGRIDVQVVSS